MFTFDPWHLLGVTPTSSIHEARKAYYDLARIMHPDHGGNADDMRALHEAYKWIYNQLTDATFPIVVDDPAKTPIMDTVIGMDLNSISDRYDEIKKTDDPRIRIMVLDWIKYIVERDLMIGGKLRSIDQYLMESIETVSTAQQSMYPASIEDGYGKLMDPPEKHVSYEDMLNDTHPPISKFTKEIAIYKEPVCANSFNMLDDTVYVPNIKDDYSGNKEKLSMTDYMVAYSPNVISNTEEYEKEKLEKALKEQCRLDDEETITD